MPAESEFKLVEVFKGMSNPDAMAILPNGEVYTIEQWTGNVWHYIPGKGAAKIGTVPTNAGLKVEDGMLGIVADLNYATTHWLYIYHTPAVMGTTQISRFTVTDEKLANQKKILEIPRTRVGSGHDERHAGGGMSWNSRTGDLYLAVGDDTYPFGDRSIYGPRDPDNAYSNALRTAANTNDLRGKCLRIRPIAFPDNQNPAAGVGTTYTIPNGNLFPVGTDKTRPEIYSMGTRNAYRVKTDTVTGWAFIGEVGADAADNDPAKGPAGYDHIYLLKKPANFGWPFGNGNMEPYKVRDYEKLYTAAGMQVGQAFDLAHLKNLSPFNTGLTDLPPVTAPLIWYSDKGFQTGIPAKLGTGSETVMIGPTYDFNPDLNSAVKLPPYFHRKVIFGDYSRHYIWLATLDTAGVLKNLERIKAGISMTDMGIGPDGSLYVLDYGGNTLYSLQYTGAQKDYKACSFIKEGCMNPRFSEYDKTANLQTANSCRTVSIRAGTPERHAPDRILVDLDLASLRVALPEGAAGLEAYSPAGVRLFAKTGVRNGTVELPARLTGRGMVFLKFLRD
jgi:glucose/arabinose dehydrogenase